MSIDYREAISSLLERVRPLGTEIRDIDEAYGRILSEDLIAEENVPSFDRSPYDGYAFRASDTEGASKDNPVTLKITDSIRAGIVRQKEVKKGEAVRLMTGSAIPRGADSVCKFEDTVSDGESVTVFKSYSPGENIVSAGEDITRGTVVAKKGFPVDPGTLGVLSSLGIYSVPLYKRPLAGIITTGDEVVDREEELPYGKIRDTNRYSITAALRRIGIDTVFLGHAGDSIPDITELIKKGEASCDLLISTGGVSVGDYDLIPEVLEKASYGIFLNGIGMKPGMACVFGEKKGFLFLGLSGNPASSVTTLQCICYPALRKMSGRKDYEHEIVQFRAEKDFPKKGGKYTRFLRGRSLIHDGILYLDIPGSQGNSVLSSMVSINAYGIVPALSRPVKKGDVIEGFFV